MNNDTLLHFLAHIPILMVCISRVFHTNSGNSPGGARPPRMSLRSRPKALQIRSKGVAWLSRNLQGRRGALGT